MAATRTAISQTLYETLADGFREHPGNYAQAARLAKCDYRTAKKAWVQGWPDKWEWAIPIKDLLASESAEKKHRAEAKMRALHEELAAQKEAAAVRAQKDREDAIEAESNMLKVARSDVLAALVVAAELSKPMRMVAQAVAELCKPKPDGSPPDIPLGQAMGVLTRYSQIVQKAMGAAEAIITLSRLDRGAATAVVGLTPVETVSHEDAVEELAAIQALLEGQGVGVPGTGPRPRRKALPPGRIVEVTGEDTVSVQTPEASAQ